MSATDFVVTIHAFERLEQRFPDLVSNMSDRDQAKLVHREVMDAIDSGRHGRVPPLELSSKIGDRWMVREQNTFFVWTQDKKRGYLMREDPDEGLLVVTVIFGMPLHLAKQKLQTRRRR
jgi:hypothetical protein